MGKTRQSMGRRLWAALVIGAAVIGGTALPAEAKPQAAEAPQLEEAEQLNEEVRKLHAAGQLDAAIPLAERALAIRERVLGPNHPDVATSLSNLAFLCEGKRDDARAESLFLRALAIREKALPPGHPDLATSLNNLADLYWTRAQYARAEPLLQRALTINEKALGPDHPIVASSLNNLAVLYADEGAADRAEPLFQRALAIRDKSLPPEHPDLATSLDNLATLYQDKGDYPRAEPLFQRALAIREKSLPPEHPDVVISLNNLANLFQDKGEYARAEPLYQRALAIREKSLPPEHPDLATSLNNLATLYQETAFFDRAEPMLQRALTINEKVLGPYHPVVATSLSNLAGLYRDKGDPVRAEPLILRALAIKEKALGLDHPEVATMLNNLASLYEDKGDDVRAEPLLERALTIRKALGPDHPAVAASLSHLAQLYTKRGSFARAEPLFQLALTIQQKALKPDHPDVALSLHNLASLYEEMGDYARAEPLFQRALGQLEKVYGKDHPGVARTLNNLASLYRRQGDYARAEPLYQRTLALWEKALGSDHPFVATSLNNLAALEEAREDYPRATALSQRAAEIHESHLLLHLATDAEVHHRRYLAVLAPDPHLYLSLAIRTADRRAVELALATLLRRKGRTLDAAASGVRLLRARLGAEEQRLFDELLTVRSRRSALTVRGPGRTPLAAYRKELADLEGQDQTLQQAINARSAAFRAAEQPITVEAVKAALPQGSALVEWSVYRPFHPKAPTAKEQWGPERYAACVLPQQGAPACVDLGEARAIDAAATSLRRALSRASGQDVKKLARDLDALVMAPVRKLLGETRWVLLSPDGALNLIPFAALVDESGRYLVEDYAFTYLTSGRDLLRLQDRSARPREAPAVIAFPDFDARGPDAPASDKGANGERGTPSLDLATVRFSALPGTASEARAVTGTVSEARVLVGPEATERAFKGLHGPLLLHVATHGFFLPDQPERHAPPGPGSDAQVGAATPAFVEDPLVRSGLAFAGANVRHSGADDGLLTAMEVSGADLYGTSLVVLSACDTGVGKVVNADGVYGLRRALVLAGARTQVMSLWKVDDAATEELMTAYYQRLQAGDGKGEAMRKVQIAMLAQSDRERPYYWASFIVSGDWAALDGKASVPEVGRVAPGPRGCACAVEGAAPEGGSAAWPALLALGLGLARRASRVSSRAK